MNLEEAIFEGAAAFQHAELPACLETRCAWNPATAARIEPLRRSCEPASFQNDGTVVSPCSPGEHCGDRIGRYRILEQIGEGAFGTVWEAEQIEPVRRRVALKIIKAGMDTKEVTARFDQERQALAMMDHPGIARVFDAGATQSGRPYFAMELVRGVKITQYCDEQKLSTNERIRLFITVCQAVQHAHQKGIIHRDLKPSNILVTVNDGEAVPKVIDFGVAKATRDRLTDNPVYTRVEDIIGTPLYMSPEQAGLTSLDIDTRSDIYSLGVLLYELLTGSTPIGQTTVKRLGLDEIRRIIREVDPRRPSTRVRQQTLHKSGTHSAKSEIRAGTKWRQAKPNQKSKIPADLDWIVMKALDKDRTRRYATANALAMDLRRFLADEPVAAAAPSACYRIHKFARRHKTAFGVSVAIVSILITATIVSVWQAIRAKEAEELASKRVGELDYAHREAEGAYKFLTELFQSPNPSRDGRAVTFAETLDRAARKLESDPGVQPARKAKMQGTIGWTYQSLGLYKEAIPLLEQSLAWYLSAYGDWHHETLIAMHNLAWSLFRDGRFDEASKLKEKILPRFLPVVGPEHQNLLDIMDMVSGPSFTAESDQKESERLVEGLLAASQSGLENRATLMAMARLALFWHDSGNSADSLKLWEKVVPLCRKLNGDDSDLTFWAMQGMAAAVAGAGRRDEAIKIEEEILALRRSKLGVDHSDTLIGMDNLADSLAAAGRRDEAIKLNVEALTLCQNRYGRDNALNFKIRNNLADFYADSGHLRTALALREDVLAFYRNQNKNDSPAALHAAAALAGTLTLLGEFERAETLLDEALAKYRKHGKPGDIETRLREMAELRFRQKQFAAAEALCTERIQSRRARPKWEGSLTVHDATTSLGRVLAEWAWAERDTSAGEAHRRALEAEKLLRESLEANLRDKAAAASRRPDVLNRLGWAIAVAALTNPSAEPAARERKLAEAEQLLLEGHAGMESHAFTKHHVLRDSFERLIRFYEARNKPESVAAWSRRMAEFDDVKNRH
jgi:eukaryotic-like serine/threonine-protein kinase